MGRTATIVMVLIAMAWIPVIKGAHGLYNYLQSVQGYLAPPIFVVFFFGVFNKRLNAKGCLWAMVVGFIMGIFRLIVDTPVSLGLAGFEHGYPEGSFLWIVNNIYFQYYSVLITLVSHRGDGRRQLRDRGAGRVAAGRPDLRDHHAGAAPRVAPAGPAGGRGVASTLVVRRCRSRGMLTAEEFAARRRPEYLYCQRVTSRFSRVTRGERSLVPGYPEASVLAAVRAMAPCADNISVSTRPCEPDGVSTAMIVATVGARSLSATFAS